MRSGLPEAVVATRVIALSDRIDSRAGSATAAPSPRKKPRRFNPDTLLMAKEYAKLQKILAENSAVFFHRTISTFSWLRQL